MCRWRLDPHLQRLRPVMECREYGSTNLSPDPLSSAHEKALKCVILNHGNGVPHLRMRGGVDNQRFSHEFWKEQQRQLERSEGGDSRAATAPKHTVSAAATAHTAPTAPTAVVATLACIGATEATADAIDLYSSEHGQQTPNAHGLHPE